MDTPTSLPSPGCQLLGHPLKNSQLLGMCAEELFDFAFSCVLTQWLLLSKRNQHTSQMGFVVIRKENRANNLVTEKNFALRALKLAMALLNQPAALKLRAVVWLCSLKIFQVFKFFLGDLCQIRVGDLKPVSLCY